MKKKNILILISLIILLFFWYRLFIQGHDRIEKIFYSDVYGSGTMKHQTLFAPVEYFIYTFDNDILHKYDDVVIVSDKKSFKQDFDFFFWYDLKFLIKDLSVTSLLWFDFEDKQVYEAWKKSDIRNRINNYQIPSRNRKDIIQFLEWPFWIFS